MEGRVYDWWSSGWLRGLYVVLHNSNLGGRGVGELQLDQRIFKYARYVEQPSRVYERIRMRFFFFQVKNYLVDYYQTSVLLVRSKSKIPF